MRKDFRLCNARFARYGQFILPYDSKEIVLRRYRTFEAMAIGDHSLRLKKFAFSLVSKNATLTTSPALTLRFGSDRGPIVETGPRSMSRECDSSKGIDKGVRDTDLATSEWAWQSHISVTWYLETQNNKAKGAKHETFQSMRHVI